MPVLCVVCKESFDLSPDHYDRELLVSCPACGFLGHWSNGSISIPTHSEEASLERVEGVPAAPLGDSATQDATIVAQAASNLPLPHKRLLVLTILNGPGEGTVIRPDHGRIILGRQDADVPLDDARVSRKHAVIEAISRENIFLRDLASTNGTYLNGVEVRSKKLENGDTIRVGDTEVRFLWEDQA